MGRVYKPCRKIGGLADEKNYFASLFAPSDIFGNVSNTFRMNENFPKQKLVPN
jgi:hypothetical protein